jgi:hypothetical protein
VSLSIEKPEQNGLEEYLGNKHKILSSNPSTLERKKKGRKEGKKTLHNAKRIAQPERYNELNMQVLNNRVNMYSLNT